MHIELNDIKGGVLEQVYSLGLSDFPELDVLARNNGPLYREPIRFELRLQRCGQLVELDGRMDARVRLNCARCLTVFEASLGENFNLTFSPVTDQPDPDEVELEAQELGLVLYRDDVLQLDEVLLEQLIMAIPIRPQCSDDCLGLCPECGLNLNEAQCQCEKKMFNNQFSALAGIRIAAAAATTEGLSSNDGFAANRETQSAIPSEDQQTD